MPHKNSSPTLALSKAKSHLGGLRTCSVSVLNLESYLGLKELHYYKCYILWVGGWQFKAEEHQRQLYEPAQLSEGLEPASQ